MLASAVRFRHCSGRWKTSTYKAPGNSHEDFGMLQYNVCLGGYWSAQQAGLRFSAFSVYMGEPPAFGRPLGSLFDSTFVYIGKPPAIWRLLGRLSDVMFVCMRKPPTVGRSLGRLSDLPVVYMRKPPAFGRPLSSLYVLVGILITGRCFVGGNNFRAKPFCEP